MRASKLLLIGLCSLWLPIAGCQKNGTPPPPNSDRQTAAPESGGTAEGHVDVDVGPGGVHVEAEGDKDRKGVDVDVGPDGVDVQVEKETPASSDDSNR